MDETHVRQARHGKNTLVVFLIMLDTWRRLILGTDARRVYVSMLLIEGLVLLLILIDFVWHLKDLFVAWRERRSYRLEILQRLEHLTQEESEALRIFVLEGKRPSNGAICKSLAEPPELLERHSEGGWHIIRQHKHLIRKWAVVRK
jgi:hypothetical protein